MPATTVRPLSARRRLVLALVSLAAVSACRDALAPTEHRARFAQVPSRSVAGVESVGLVEGQVIVRYRPGVDRDAVAEDHGAALDHELPLSRTAVLEVAPGDEIATAASLASDSRVEFAEPDYLTVLAPCEVGSCQTTTDPFLGYRWDLNNTGEIRNSAGALLAVTGAPDADVDWLELYDALGATFSGSATVGIIDTGIRATHEDLVGTVIAAQNFATGYPSTLTDDRAGHGTHVAGIVAGRGNNGRGATGIAYGANIKLINAKACELYLFPDNSVQTSCPSSSVASAIVWAVDQGANVLNISLGGAPNATAGSAAQLAALQYARSKNVLPLCAAGNDNYPDVSFPARFAECVAVSATNWSDARASYSNYGDKVELSAPGGDVAALPAGSSPVGFILSTYIGTGANADRTYAWAAGTSMATPQVAGLAAMLYASGLRNADAVLARMKETADDLGPPGRDPEYGAGRINVYRAVLQRDPNAPPVAHIDPVAPGVEGSAVAFSSAGSSDPNGHAISYHWSFGDGATSIEANPTHVYADDGAYTVSLTVTDESNLSTTVSTTARVTNAPPVATASLAADHLLSGETASLHGTFTDAGVNDAPWSWSANFGEGVVTGVLLAEGPVDASRRVCAAGAYAATLTVTDKDAGVSSSSVPLTVARRQLLSFRTPESVNLKGGGKVEVAVDGVPGFDLRSLDLSTVTLGDGTNAGAPIARKSDGRLEAQMEGENDGDGGTLGIKFDRAVLAEALGAASSPVTLVMRATLTDGCTQVEGHRITRVVIGGNAH